MGRGRVARRRLRGRPQRGPVDAHQVTPSDILNLRGSLRVTRVVRVSISQRPWAVVISRFRITRDGNRFLIIPGGTRWVLAPLAGRAGSTSRWISAAAGPPAEEVPGEG